MKKNRNIFLMVIGLLLPIGAMILGLSSNAQEKKQTESSLGGIPSHTVQLGENRQINGFRTPAPNTATAMTSTNFKVVVATRSDLPSGDFHQQITNDGSLTGISETCGISVGDFNGDALLDFVVSFEDDNQLGIYLNQCGSVAPNNAPFDFDGDARSDISIFRPDNTDNDNNFWYINQSSNNTVTSIEWGIGSDQIAPADYDCDNKTDYAVWRESEANFYIFNSMDNLIRIENFGLEGDVLTVGD